MKGSRSKTRRHEAKPLWQWQSSAVWEHCESHLISSTIETQIATLSAYRKSLIHACVTVQRRVGG
jgi:hypothetical protein